MNHHNFIYNGDELFAFGYNECGQLGLGLLSRGRGELLAFGYNGNGELGLGDDNNRLIPTLLMQNRAIQQVVCERFYSFILK